MPFEWSWILLIAGALLVLVEVALGGFAGFDLVLIGSAFVIGGAIGLATRQPTLALVVASALCVAYILIGRRWVRERMRGRSAPSNVDALLGRSGIVTQRISEHDAGMVKVDGEVWRALPARGSSAVFEAGAEVTIESVDGVTVHVR